MAEKEGFFRTWRGDRLRWLIHHKPDALRLLLLIQDRARYSDGWNPLNLEKRQSVLGFSDVEVWGWTIRRYRTAKSDLVTAGAIDIVPTGKGTIVTLLDNVAYVSEPPKNDGQNDIPSDIPSDIVATDPRHSGDIVATDPRHLTKKDNKLRREEGKKQHPPAGGGDGDDFLSVDSRNLWQRIVDSGKVRAGQFSAEAWFQILRANPEFDPGDGRMVAALMAFVECMDKTIGQPPSWFANKMGQACKGEGPELDLRDYPNFEKWWEAYPLKVGKVRALGLWVNKGLEARSVEGLLQTLAYHAEMGNWTECEAKFVTKPVKYLEDELFKDEVAKKNKNGGQSSDRPDFTAG